MKMLKIFKSESFFGHGVLLLHWSVLSGRKEIEIEIIKGNFSSRNLSSEK